MKKKIIAITFITAIALTAGWNLSQNDKEILLSNLALNNVEVLAEAETSGEFTGSTGCVACCYDCRCGAHTYAYKA